MPFGLQVIGPLRGDAALLAAAQAMEQAFQADAATRRPRPGIPGMPPPFGTATKSLTPSSRGTAARSQDCPIAVRSFSRSKRA